MSSFCYEDDSILEILYDKQKFGRKIWDFGHGYTLIKYQEDLDGSRRYVKEDEPEGRFGRGPDRYIVESTPLGHDRERLVIYEWFDDQLFWRYSIDSSLTDPSEASLDLRKVHRCQKDKEIESSDERFTRTRITSGFFAHVERNQGFLMIDKERFVA